MVTNKPTTKVQIMSQSDIMKNTNRQNYKINKKIWDEIEKQNNNGNENIEPEIPIEVESRDVTFNVSLMGTPITEELHQGQEFPITVDGVTKYLTEENEEVTFNLSDGSHNVKIILYGAVTYYDNIHIVDEEHTEFTLDIEQKNVEINVLYKNTNEQVSTSYYSIIITDVNTNYTSSSLRSIFKVPYIIEVYNNTSELIYEGRLEADETSKTIEIPKPEPRMVTFIVKDNNGNILEGATVFVEDDMNEVSEITESDGSCTIELIDGDYRVSASKNNEGSSTRYYSETYISVSETETQFEIQMTQQESIK